MKNQTSWLVVALVAIIGIVWYEKNKTVTPPAAQGQSAQGSDLGVSSISTSLIDEFNSSGNSDSDTQEFDQFGVSGSY